MPIYYKLHPRSCKKVINILKKEFDEAKYICRSDIVVGHYSSLLDQAKERGINCFVIDLTTHKVPDKYINTFAILPKSYDKNICFNYSVKYNESAYDEAFEIIKNQICQTELSDSV